MQLHRHRIIEKLEKRNTNMERVQNIRKRKLGLADSLSTRRLSLSSRVRPTLSLSSIRPVMDRAGHGHPDL